MRSTTIEAPRSLTPCTSRTSRAPLLSHPRLLPPPPTGTTRVLIRQVRVLGLMRFAKVAFLHDGGEGGDVDDGGFSRGGVVSLGEDVEVLRNKRT